MVLYKKQKHTERQKQFLKKALANSKPSKWEDLKSELNSVPWDLCYRILMCRLGSRASIPVIDSH